MIVNLYINEGKVIASHVDESTKHRRGDALSINDRRYVLTDLVEFEHLDYLTIVYVNYLMEKPPDLDADEKELDHAFYEELQTVEQSDSDQDR